jgi:hypothetical protein
MVRAQYDVSYFSEDYFCPGICEDSYDTITDSDWVGTITRETALDSMASSETADTNTYTTFSENMQFGQDAHVSLLFDCVDTDLDAYDCFPAYFDGDGCYFDKMYFDSCAPIFTTKLITTKLDSVDLFDELSNIFVMVINESITTSESYNNLISIQVSDNFGASEAVTTLIATIVSESFSTYEFLTSPLIEIISESFGLSDDQRTQLILDVNEALENTDRVVTVIRGYGTDTVGLDEETLGTIFYRLLLVGTITNSLQMTGTITDDLDLNGVITNALTLLGKLKR